jgi:hypothetical protein
MDDLIKEHENIDMQKLIYKSLCNKLTDLTSVYDEPQAKNILNKISESLISKLNVKPSDMNLLETELLDLLTNNDKTSFSIDGPVNYQDMMGRKLYPSELVHISFIDTNIEGTEKVVVESQFGVVIPVSISEFYIGKVASGFNKNDSEVKMSTWNILVNNRDLPYYKLIVYKGNLDQYMRVIASHISLYLIRIVFNILDSKFETFEEYTKANNGPDNKLFNMVFHIDTINDYYTITLSIENELINEYYNIIKGLSKGEVAKSVKD